MSDRHTRQRAARPRPSRRQLLARLGTAALAGAGAALLSACSGAGAPPLAIPSPSPVPTQPAPLPPRPTVAVTATPPPAGRPAALGDARTLRHRPLSDDPVSHDFNLDPLCGGLPELFAGLLQLDPDLEPVPAVAERYTVSADGLSYTFTLRADARWSDGTRLTARDFVWSWTRQLDPASGATLPATLALIKNAAALARGRVRPSELGLSAPNERTLQVTLERPAADFPALVALPAALPAHRPSVERFGEGWTDPGITGAPVVGNGPWVLTAWQHGAMLELRRNSHFGAPASPLERLIVPIIPASQGLLAYERGAVECLGITDALTLQRARSEPALRDQLRPSLEPGGWYLVPQVTKAPFDSQPVRRALAHAIDRERLAEASGGLAMPAATLLPPGMPGHLADPALALLQRFDPAQALAVLRGTPFEGGRGWPELVLTVREEAHGSRAMAEALLAMLRQHLGLIGRLRVLEAREFADRVARLEPQLALVRWQAEVADPQAGYGLFDPERPGGRQLAWQQEGFASLLSRARTERDPAQRREHYRALERQLQEAGAYIPLAWPLSQVLVKPWVRGLEQSRAGYAPAYGRLYVREARALTIQTGGA